MKVAVVNKFWYHRGGLEQVMFDEIELLTAKGHEVVHFSTAHPLNEPSPWSGYFAPYIELGERAGLSAKDRLLAAKRLFYNEEAARRFERLLRDTKPDVVHAHGVHRQLSPSVLGVAVDAGVPLVQTLHDYHPVCPADTLLRGGTTACVPRVCGNRWFGPSIRYRCRGDSLVGDVAALLELAIRRGKKTRERYVARFIAPSVFMRDVLLDAGWEPRAIDVVPNAVGPMEARDQEDGPFLFLGRVVPMKGAEVMLRAARLAGVPAAVAGDGPEVVRLRSEHPEASFPGWIERDRVPAAIRSARALVLPSLCPENAPVSVLEAMAAGVPVIASAIGGVPELVRDGIDGILVPPGDEQALADAMASLWADRGLAVRMGAAGRERASRVYSREVHYERLFHTYQVAVASRGLLAAGAGLPAAAEAGPAG